MIGWLRYLLGMNEPPPRSAEGMPEGCEGHGWLGVCPTCGEKSRVWVVRDGVWVCGLNPRCYGR